MSRYKVGDKVRVREDLEDGGRYDNVLFNREMKDCCGEIATINLVEENRYNPGGYAYRLNEDASRHLWTEAMLEPTKDDNVNHPAHYQTAEGLEVIDIIDAVCSDGIDEYYRGNIIKYVCCYKQKGGSESLRKAEWYLQRLIALQETIEEIEGE